MAGSQHSDDSANSNASSYSSVRVSDDGRRAQARASSAPVPDDAPPLFANAGTGVYDQTARQFYAVNTAQPKGQQVARWSKSAAAWVSENKSRIVKALVDVTPTIIQGAAGFTTGRAKTIVSGVGIAAQAGVAGYELYDQAKQSLAGGHVDPVQVSASLGRLASTALNTYAAVADQEAAATARVGGAGSWVAGAATMTDVVHHAHTDPGRVAADPGYEMYGMHRNPTLGNQPGQYPPGFTPAPAPPSSNSSLSAPANNTPAGNFSPAGTSSGRVSRQQPAEAQLSQKAQGKKPVGRR
ncbi:hypothetical protein UK15_16185 [Streptomyces variegatus]|uniref:Uncharacterized protein n=1 Tax=Streptomyces variegatus TaxID=284040 RepID=A0A0M2GT22_9ACTN|nr:MULTISPECIES: hypothetical protein [Streptomyces]KJK38614.1 hypothetical protein UK15_16185 [Streptomyces variegatus]